MGALGRYCQGFQPWSKAVEMGVSAVVLALGPWEFDRVDLVLVLVLAMVLVVLAMVVSLMWRVFLRRARGGDAVLSEMGGSNNIVDVGCGALESCVGSSSASGGPNRAWLGPVFCAEDPFPRI